MKVRTNRLLLMTWCFWLVLEGGAIYLRQRTEYAAIIGVHDLSDIVPKEFGGWEVATNAPTTIVNPLLRQSVNDTYDETLSRTYVNRTNGHYVMLSIAYGRDQSHDKQIHKPEVCYPSQGFQLGWIKNSQFMFGGREVPVTILHASKGSRSEYIIYWIVEGDSVVRGATQQNVRRALLALRGIREDGILLRVSEISSDENASIEILREFVASMIGSLDPAMQSKFVGSNIFTLVGRSH